MLRILFSETGMGIQRHLNLVNTTSGLHVKIIWRDLIPFERTTESLTNVYKDVPSLLTMLLARKIFLLNFDNTLTENSASPTRYYNMTFKHAESTVQTSYTYKDISRSFFRYLNFSGWILIPKGRVFQKQERNSPATGTTFCRIPKSRFAPLPSILRSIYSRQTTSYVCRMSVLVLRKFSYTQVSACLRLHYNFRLLHGLFSLEAMILSTLQATKLILRKNYTLILLTKMTDHEKKLYSQIFFDTVQYFIEYFIRIRLHVPLSKALFNLMLYVQHYM